MKAIVLLMSIITCLTKEKMWIMQILQRNEIVRVKGLTLTSGKMTCIHDPSRKFLTLLADNFLLQKVEDTRESAVLECI